ncbi:uncharacterized protein LOC125873752 [Solanum stenotomum]|uniref:uncharacterized protein LOC125873752 n=1 Tax=Solanum stenotomum TaxID=172797 RepID=UPI0020CFEF09|nr:uncharacterized protein LOC125873752 [Solanum stenotomum]
MKLEKIPFADFANHCDLSDTTVLCSEEKQLSEVIVDYSYSPGDQMLIRYGKFSNARLLLDFGFTLPCNVYDQVEVELTIPHEDKLRQLKLELLSKHQIPILKDVNGFSSSENSFVLKEVRFADAQGRGIPQSIRAFARVLCSNSPQEINYLAMEAAENDGRVARRPLKDKSREIQAHQFLLSKITGLIDEYNASIKSLELPTLCMVGKIDMRRQMAQYLLTGYIVCSHIDADIILGKGRSTFSFLECLNCNFMGNNIIRINYNTIGFVKFSLVTLRMRRCMKHGKRGKDD